jgi:hypothetical protein
MADPLVAMLIEPDTGPPVGSATGTGAGVCPAGTGVAGGSGATACTAYGACVAIGTGVGVGVGVAVTAGVGVTECEGGVTPPPPPHPVAATHSVDTMAKRSSACLKSKLLITCTPVSQRSEPKSAQSKTLPYVARHTSDPSHGRGALVPIYKKETGGLHRLLIVLQNYKLKLSITDRNAARRLTCRNRYGIRIRYIRRTVRAGRGLRSSRLIRP